MSVVATLKQTTTREIARNATPRRGIDRRRGFAWSDPTRDVEDAANRLIAVATSNNEQAPMIASLMNALADAVEASHLDTLLDALERPEILAELRQQDPLAPARLRGLRAKQRLLEAEGGVVSGQELANLINISRQAVDKRRQKGTLIAVHLGKKGYAYPVWQADLAGLNKVLAELREYGPWTQVAFMLSSNTWLGGETPLVMLRRGNIDDVVTAAGMYGEQTASAIFGEHPQR